MSLGDTRRVLPRKVMSLIAVDVELLSTLASEGVGNDGDRNSGRILAPPFDKVTEHMEKLVRSVQDKEIGGRSLGFEVESWPYNTRRAVRFLNLWMRQCDGYSLKQDVPKSDVLESTYTDFVEAVIITLMGIISRQEREVKWQTVMALTELIPSWMLTLRVGGRHEGCYDFEILLQICDVLSEIMGSVIQSGLVGQHDLHLIPWSLQLYGLALAYFADLIEGESFMLMMDRSIRMCSFHPEMAEAQQFLRQSVEILDDAVTKYPHFLEYVRQSTTSAAMLHMLSQFAAQSVVLEPICNFMSNLVLIPGNLPTPRNIEVVKPCLEAGADLLHGDASRKCLKALKIALEYATEIFRDGEELDKIIKRIESISTVHSGETVLRAAPDEDETLHRRVDNTLAVSTTLANEDLRSHRTPPEPSGVTPAGSILSDSEDFPETPQTRDIVTMQSGERQSASRTEMPLVASIRELVRKELERVKKENDDRRKQCDDLNSMIQELEVETNRSEMSAETMASLIQAVQTIQDQQSQIDGSSVRANRNAP